MLCILSNSYDPAFNLAAEEYLFKHFTDDIFFLYVNDPAVVVGKHQNALAEINPVYVRENKVQVIRRLSGGGAVYHDRGNLNFSFHQTVPDPAKISFKNFNLPLVEVLHTLEVNAQISPRNDIFVDEYKVSGHAEHVFRNRILSHGTLLYNAQKSALSQALKNPAFENYKGKAIQSVRSKVANIAEFLDKPLSMKEFVTRVLQYQLNASPLHKMYTFSEADVLEIEKLSVQKYATWEWNFAYSPSYQFTQAAKDFSFSVFLKVEKGYINTLEIGGDYIDTALKNDVQLKLQNSPHRYEDIEQCFFSLGLDGTKLARIFF